MARHAAELYEQDFYAWAQDQAAALRRMQAERWNGPLDLEHLAEEVEYLGEEQARAVRSHLIRVIQHLLKLEFSPSLDPRRGWLLSVDDARYEAVRRVSRKIRDDLDAEVDDLYRRARKRARLELLRHGEKSAADALPPVMPYSLDEVLEEDWLPANRHGLVDED